MNPYKMPNLVGLRDIPSPPMMEDQGKRDTILAIQMEALGMTRRDFLSTRDFKENRLNYISTSDLEPQRLVNKGSIGKREKSKLEGWNSKTTSTKYLVIAKHKFRCMDTSTRWWHWCTKSTNCQRRVGPNSPSKAHAREQRWRTYRRVGLSRKGI